MSIKSWNVRVHPAGGGGSIELGQVHEDNEELARCAALSKFGIEGERATVHALDGNPVPRCIYEDDDFDVGLA